MAWTNLQSAFGYGTKLTSANMQQLRDNIAAAFAKDGGAPQLATDYIQTVMIDDLQVTEAKLAASVYGRDKVKQSTGTVTGTAGASSYTNITMQDYCFSPSISAEAANFNVHAWSGLQSDTTGRFVLFNDSGSSNDYDVDYRYITATDEPFIFALINKITGKIEHLWMCDDSPQGFWGLDEKPDDFIPPIIVENPDNYNEVVLFKQDKLFFKELQDKRKKDKKFLIQVFNDYEYDNNTKLFKSKNLVTI